MGVMKVTDNTDKLRKAVKELTSKRVLVGIPISSSRASEPGETDAPPPNAVLGYIHEFGEPDRGIPPRPTLLPGVESVFGQISAAMKQGGRAALSGKPGAADQAFNMAGLIAVNGVQAYITNGEFVPLSAMTIRKRLEKGFTGTKPLIVSGQFRKAFTYIVETKGR